MYCPNCKQEFPGKFCPECGTKLIEKPAQNDISVGLGGNAAVVGGININKTETHNTTSYIENIVERPKSEGELHKEHIQKFMERCKQVFRNGLLTEEEMRELETERLRLGIGEAEAERLMEIERKSSGGRMTTLGLRDATTLKNIDRFIDSNMHNAVGLHLFLTNGFSIDRQKELLAKMPETYLNHPKVQQVIKNLELKEKTLVGKPFTDFEMPTPDGSTLKLSDVVSKHKYTLIDYWATWCAPCRKEMPHVIEAYNEYGQKGLAIIGISLDNHADKWKAAIKEWKMPWLHMSDLKGWKCEGATLYCVHAVPATVIIAQDGTIVARDLRGEALMAKLAELMK